MAMPASRSASNFSVPGINQELIEAMRKFDYEKLANWQEPVKKDVTLQELKEMLEGVIKRLDAIESLLRDSVKKT
jgi:hypothetical protein